jgi:hypothetical protein
MNRHRIAESTIEAAIGFSVVERQGLPLQVPVLHQSCAVEAVIY